jgi:hypothetical protein
MPPVCPGLTRGRALLTEVDGESGLGHLVVEEAQLPLDLIDLELNVLELVLHGERLADRRRPGEERAEHGPASGQVLQMRPVVDELVGHVLARDGRRLHRAQRAHLPDRVVEVRGGDADRQRSGGRAVGLRRQDESAVRVSDRDHPGEFRSERAVRDREGDRAVSDDLREVGRLRLVGGVPGASVCVARGRQHGPGGPPPRRSRRWRRPPLSSDSRCRAAPAHRSRTPPRGTAPPRRATNANARAGATAPSRPSEPSRERRPVSDPLRENRGLDVRLHQSTSLVSISPRSWRTSARRRSPRLTRWRAAVSAHCKRAATSG